MEHSTYFKPQEGHISATDSKILQQEEGVESFFDPFDSTGITDRAEDDEPEVRVYDPRDGKEDQFKAALEAFNRVDKERNNTIDVAAVSSPAVEEPEVEEVITKPCEPDWKRKSKVLDQFLADFGTAPSADTIDVAVEDTAVEEVTTKPCETQWDRDRRAFKRFFNELGTSPSADTIDVTEEPAGLEPEPELIDTAEAERMLMALYGHTKVIACTYGDTNRYTPARQGEKYDWDAVPDKVDWDKVRSDLQYVSTRNLGFISCPGGTRVKDRQGKPAEIFECSLLVYEIDHKEFTQEQQYGVWLKAGLPEPTLVMDTGNKSLHVWFRLSEPVTPEQGKDARKRLSRAIDAVLPEGVKTDKGMNSTHQPARLAGGIHPKTGKRSTIVLETGNVFDLDELMAKCPELPVDEKSTSITGTIWRQSPDDYELDDQDDVPLPLTTADGEVVSVPLEIALGYTTVELIKTGQEPGSGEGRRPMLHRLSKTLQCAEEQLNELGQPFTGSALELWQDCAAASNSDGDLDDIDAVYDSHWSFDDIGEGDLSREVLMLRLQSFAIDNGLLDPLHWVEKLSSSWILKGRLQSLLSWTQTLQSRIKEARGQAELDEEFLVESKNIVHQIEQGWEKIARLERPAERAAAQQKLCKKLGIYPQEMTKIVTDLLLEQNDENQKFSKVSDVLSHDFRTTALVERWIPRGRLSMLAADSGASKTVKLYEVAEGITIGGKVFGELQADLGKVLYIQADEPVSDANTKFQRLGLNHDDDRLTMMWDFSPSMFPDLERRIVEEKIDCVIMDALISIFGGGTAKLTDAEIAVPLYQLNKIAGRTGAAVVLTHHLKKASDDFKDKEKEHYRRPSDADIFGSAFIKAAVSDIWLLWQDGEELDGSPSYAMECRKGRSGLMQKGQRFHLSGDMETWRSTLKADAGEASLSAARTIEEKILAFLRLHPGKWFTAQEIAQSIGVNGFTTNRTQISNALSKLHNDEKRTGVKRQMRTVGVRGRKPFEYGVS